MPSKDGMYGNFVELVPNASNSNNVFRVNNDGYVDDNNNVNNSNAVRPAVHSLLKHARY